MSIKAALVIVAIACLAGVALSASDAAGRIGSVKEMACHFCTDLVTKFQTQLPAVRPALDHLCDYCGSPEANQKCLDKFHELEDKLEHLNPKEACQLVGLCHDAPQGGSQDLSGQGYSHQGIL